MDDIREYEKRNTVRAERQLSGSLRFFEREGRGKRVLFAGNSITLHSPKADIGWQGSWGMAASDAAHDYIHLLASRFPGMDAGIAQVAEWERGFLKGKEAMRPYTPAAEWDPDIIVFRAGENTPENMLAEGDYAQAVQDLMRFFNRGGRAKMIVTSLFWPNPAKDEAIRRAAECLGAVYVPLNDLGTRDDMKALGLFWHSGVANHPGDLGMQAIADRIGGALEPFLKDENA